MDKKSEDHNYLPEDDDLLTYFLSNDSVLDNNDDLPATRSLVTSPLPVRSLASSSLKSKLGSTKRGAPFSHDTEMSAQGQEDSSGVSSSNMRIKTEKQPSSSNDGGADAITSGGGSTMVKESATTKGSAGGSSVMEEAERRRRRLARNRESARQSRRRKKQYLELLEEKVSQLTEEIDGMRRVHLEVANRELRQLKQQLILDMNQKLRDLEMVRPVTVESQNELQEGLRILHQRYGPNCDERKTVTEFHFQQLRNLLLPPYTKFVLWVMTQEESFFNSNNTSSSSNSKDQERDCCSASELWPLLSNELGLTLEQEEKLKQQFKNKENHTSRSERRKLSIAMVYLERLRQSMMQRAGAVDEYTNTIRNILTPSQNIRFLGWMETNRQKLATAGFDRGLRTRMPPDSNNSMEQPQEQDMVEKILAKADDKVTIEEVTLLLSAMAGNLPSAQNFEKGACAHGGILLEQMMGDQSQTMPTSGSEIAGNDVSRTEGGRRGVVQQQPSELRHNENADHFKPLQQQNYQQHNNSMHHSSQYMQTLHPGFQSNNYGNISSSNHTQSDFNQMGGMVQSMSSGMVSSMRGGNDTSYLPHSQSHDQMLHGDSQYTSQQQQGMSSHPMVTSHSHQDMHSMSYSSSQPQPPGRVIGGMSMVMSPGPNANDSPSQTPGADVSSPEGNSPLMW